MSKTRVLPPKNWRWYKINSRARSAFVLSTSSHVAFSLTIIICVAAAHTSIFARSFHSTNTKPFLRIYRLRAQRNNIPWKIRRNMDRQRVFLRIKNLIWRIRKTTKTFSKTKNWRIRNRLKEKGRLPARFYGKKKSVALL